MTTVVRPAMSCCKARWTSNSDSESNAEVASSRIRSRGFLRMAAAAQQLGVSVRHVKRLVRRYREAGATGLVSHRRGRPSPRAVKAGWREHLLTLVCRYYADFGPTLVFEKQECHGEVVSWETLLQWLIAAGVWQPHRRRTPPPAAVWEGCSKSTGPRMTSLRAGR